MLVMRCRHHFFVLLLCASIRLLSAQSIIAVDPAVITHCSPSGLGTATIVWNYTGAGPVFVHVNSPTGPAMTGPSGPQGTAPTGTWVTDGMVFALTDAGGKELGRTTARVQCNPRGEVLPAALSTAPYFPLQVGDQWVYLHDSRAVTGEYRLRRISRAEIIGTTTWFVMEESTSGSAQVTETRYRNDDSGRIFQLTAQGEQLWLDPTPNPSSNAVLTVGKSAPLTVQTPASSFSNAISYSTTGFILENGFFARGVGLVTSTAQILAGSSGGFDQSYTLVYAKIDGNLVFGSPAKALELAADAASFDATNHVAANCALPCYFAACGLGVLTPDPPGTYKPCFGARVRLEQSSSDAVSVDLDLLDDTNQSLYHATVISPAESSTVVQGSIPLYSTPNMPFPPGNYQLRAKTADGRIASIPIKLL